MNKFLIILLAVCLVSVHAFVKREASTEKPIDIEAIKKPIEEALATIGDKLKSLAGSVDLEQLKKIGNELLDGAKESVDKLTGNVPSTTPSQ